MITQNEILFEADIYGPWGGGPVSFSIAKRVPISSVLRVNPESLNYKYGLETRLGYKKRLMALGPKAERALEEWEKVKADLPTMEKLENDAIRWRNRFGKVSDERNALEMDIKNMKNEHVKDLIKVGVGSSLVGGIGTGLIMK